MTESRSVGVNVMSLESDAENVSLSVMVLACVGLLSVIVDSCDVL